jgi:hypothetical protein
MRSCQAARVPLSEAIIMRVNPVGPSAELHRLVLTSVALKGPIIKLYDLSFAFDSSSLRRQNRR